MVKQTEKSTNSFVQIKLDVLLKDYEITNSKIEKFVGNQFLYTQGALVLSAGYIFFLVEGVALIDSQINILENTKFYLQFFPFFILAILSAVVYQYQRTKVLQIYRNYLEEKINSLVKENLMFFSKVGIKYAGIKNVMIWVNMIVYLSLYVAACALAFVKPEGANEPIWLVIHTFIGLLFILVAGYQTSKLNKNVLSDVESLSQL